LITVNHAFPDSQVDFHDIAEVQPFPHIGRIPRTYTLPNQINTLDANREQLRQEAVSILGRIGVILRGVSADHEKRLASAIGETVPVSIEDEAVRFLSMNPTVMQSAIDTAASLRDLVGRYAVSEMVVGLSYDVELETEKIVVCLKVNASRESAFEQETEILSYLDAKLSDDDKLSIAVRVK